PRLLCAIVENPPQRFPVGLHYQDLVDRPAFPPYFLPHFLPFHPTSPPHTLLNHMNPPLPRRGGEGLAEAINYTPYS
ncbi:hypothetical protein KUCAC02_019764, partial [Chaenocephalus aceratus]